MANAAKITERGSDGITFETPTPASQPGDTFPAGTIVMYAGGSAPAGWAICDGSLVARASFPVYAAQMSSDGYPWGAGDGVTTLGIPDFRDRNPMGKSGTKALGSVGGSDTAALGIANMPAHSHGGLTGSSAPNTGAESASHTHTATFTGYDVNGGGLINSGHAGAAPSNGAGQTTVNAGTTAASNNHIHAVNAHQHSIPSEGSGTAFQVINKYATINYIIRLY